MGPYGIGDSRMIVIKVEQYHSKKPPKSAAKGAPKDPRRGPCKTIDGLLAVGPKGYFVSPGSSRNNHDMKRGVGSGVGC